MRALLAMLNTLAATLAATAALAGAPAPARADADAFATAATGAVRVAHVDDLVWALVAPCDRGDDVEQRQCRLVRDKKSHDYLGQTLLLDADADAFDLGKWDAARKSVPLSLSACIRCRGIVLDGRAWHVMGSGTPPHFEGGKLRAGTLYDNARRFADEAAATAWAKTLKGLRVELLVKVPEKRRWQVGGKDGMQLDIVGYRVVSPCDGSVIVSAPESGDVTPDKRACKAPAITEVPTGDGPETITASMVQLAMKPVLDAAAACHEHYGIDGKASLDITIASDGTVDRFQQSGDFTGTPTGQCIDTAMRSVMFPRSQRAQTKIAFPVILQ